MEELNWLKDYTVRSSFQAEITQLRQALIGYAARFGAADLETQRTVAARIWRAIPRGLGAAGALMEAEQRLAKWGSEVLGQQINAAELRLAMLTTGADPLQLLSQDEAVRQSFTTKVAPALLQLSPLETSCDMPVRSLAWVTLFPRKRADLQTARAA